MKKPSKTDHDPNKVLMKVTPEQKLFHKESPHGKRIYILAVISIFAVFGAIFTAVGTARLLRTAQCNASRGDVCNEDPEPVENTPLDPRCEMNPDHPKCQIDGEDPVDPDPPGDDPLPPTDPGDADNVLSGDVTLKDGFTVPGGEVWVFDPTKDTTVTVEANVIVKGVLEMRPNSDVEHLLKFENVDESKFVGGGLNIIDDDVGLWVIEDGILDVWGEEKAGWNRTGTDPTWDASDEIMVAPVAVGDYTPKPFTLGSTVPQLDPSVPKAEVFNLTRNVRIEGTPGAHAHVMIMSSMPQTIKYASLRYLGVSTTLGRYPLHFHFRGDDSRGSLVEGVVVRDSDEHAFVAHASHGVTFRDTVAYNVEDHAYWWDPIKGTGSDENATDDIVYDHALAIQVLKDESHKFNLCGFDLLAGEGGQVFDSAAVAIMGQKEAAGFCWAPNDLQVWEFHDNVAHNNPKNGIWVWQNDGTVHNVNDFIAYANAVGIDHGAYSNDYRYNDIYLYKNGVGIELHVAGKSNTVWQCVKERASTSGVFISVLNSNAGTIAPVTFAGADYTGTIEDNAPKHTIDERVQFTDASCPYN